MRLPTNAEIMGASAIACGAAACVFVAALVIAYGEPVREARCIDVWKDTGIASQYRKDFGCYVQLKDGTWAPDHKVRFER